MTAALLIREPGEHLASPSPAKAVVGIAGGRGRGIFASCPILAGEVILVDPTVELSEADCLAARPTPVEDYHFAHPDSADKGLLVLGLASIANHDAKANTATEYSHVPGLGWMIALRAVRDIRAGEEITRCYACEPWFAVA